MLIADDVGINKIIDEAKLKIQKGLFPTKENIILFQLISTFKESNLHFKIIEIIFKKEKMVHYFVSNNKELLSGKNLDKMISIAKLFMKNFLKGKQNV